MTNKSFTTKGIVLARTNFGEADRILTFLTRDHGKVKVIAKGSRKAKSKLAGGIEPFSISDLTVMVGKGDVMTLMSSRLIKHFGNISSSLERMNAASAVMRLMNKNTEDETDAEHFLLLSAGFESLNNIQLDIDLCEMWFSLQFLKLAGHWPNLQSDISGQKLEEKQKYNFDPEKMTFFTHPGGKYGANHIKFLRLAGGLNRPEAVARIQAPKTTLGECVRLVELMLKSQFNYQAMN